jgi:ATP-dependent helicase/DNAse subunit B
LAEHLRHQFVRQGSPLRPKSIQTLAAFLDACSPLVAAPEAVVHLWMERALERLRPARFREVAEFPGVVRALAGLFNQVSGTKLPDDVGRLFAEVERELAARGFGARHTRLRAAAERVASGEIALPPRIEWRGFFKLSAAEREFSEALRQRTEVVIEDPREDTAGGGRTVVFRAASIEREVEEIARRILAQATNGRPFREMAVVLRSRDPYGPLVETTLARFGIPAHSYFIDPLGSHPAIQFRATLVRAALAGWDQEVLLRAVQSPASGLGGTLVGDVQDFALRVELPARGWHETAGLNRGDRLEAAEWAERLRALRTWAPVEAVEDRAGETRVHAWRSLAAAEKGWTEVLAVAEQAFADSGKVTLATFWRYVETALELEPLRVADARREVVHVLDAFEARQWSLPVMFVCGMTERHFPQYHREDPIVGDAALRRAGLDTAADREREEHFLYEMVSSRATVETVLSYPRYDEAGQDTLPSFFLPALPVEEVTTRVRPTPRLEIATPSPAGIQGGLTDQTLKLSASSIDDYVQCPFKFFVRKTLRVKERPLPPRDRLNLLLQGNILHAALAEWARMPILGDAALEEAYEQACRQENIPRTYRAEAVRLELLRHFRAFTRDSQVTLAGWTSRTEESFEFPLHPGLILRGRLDRIDVGPNKQALVIDYKYSQKDIRDRLRETEGGGTVQAGIYLLAAEKHFGLKPSGMLFCHAKKGVQWGGWHAGMEGLGEIGEARTPDAFAELAKAAEASALRVYEEAGQGRIAVEPRDPKKCAWCDVRDVCRHETMVQVRGAGE